MRTDDLNIRAEIAVDPRCACTGDIVVDARNVVDRRFVNTVVSVADAETVEAPAFVSTGDVDVSVLLVTDHKYVIIVAFEGVVKAVAALRFTPRRCDKVFIENAVDRRSAFIMEVSRITAVIFENSPQEKTVF